jgi:hypothetical protein
MTDKILVEGDKAIFLPNFGVAIVTVRPGTLSASGPMLLDGKKVCVEGDEQQLSVPGCAYVTPVYSIPGTGTLKIAALAGDQKAAKTNTGGKAILLKGSQFQASFEVQSPAQQPPPGPGSPIPDTTPSYAGKGRFTTMNWKLEGT